MIDHLALRIVLALEYTELRATINWDLEVPRGRFLYLVVVFLVSRCVTYGKMYALRKALRYAMTRAILSNVGTSAFV